MQPERQPELLQINSNFGKAKIVNFERERMACEEIVQHIIRAMPADVKEVNILKIKVSRKYGLRRILDNPAIISSTNAKDLPLILSTLQLKRTRSISGVNVISVMSSPRPCPHGRCAFCPSYQGVPVSYTGFEPAAMRGIQNEFDPFRQVSCRIAQLERIGHSANKIELVVQGGTFPAAPIDYQKFFIRRCLDAICGDNSENLEDAKHRAETSRLRNVGITVETRPDWAREADVDNMLHLGVTRVEIGVQSPDDRIYLKVERGHTVKDVVEAFRICKDAGLKIVAHMMLGLPDSSFDKDLEAFHRLFDDPNYRPDMLKVYPCLVLEGTKLYEWWKEGEYRPYSAEEATDLIAEVKSFIPPWIRVMRIQRDIPANLVVAGVTKGNLRELVRQKMEKKGTRCICIRCREVGQKMLRDCSELHPEDVDIIQMKYGASEGSEIFISAEDPSRDILVGYLRLRFPSPKAHRPEIRTQAITVVRELRVCGPMVPVGQRTENAWQHKGYGKRLISEAERVSRDLGAEKMVTLSALGTKPYYRKLGYSDDGPYVSKIIRA